MFPCVPLLLASGHFILLCSLLVMPFLVCPLACFCLPVPLWPPGHGQKVSRRLRQRTPGFVLP
jgi:hypothetical protein